MSQSMSNGAKDKYLLNLLCASEWVGNSGEFHPRETVFGNAPNPANPALLFDFLAWIARTRRPGGVYLCLGASGSLSSCYRAGDARKERRR